MLCVWHDVDFCSVPSFCILVNINLLLYVLLCTSCVGFWFSFPVSFCIFVLMSLVLAFHHQHLFFDDPDSFFLSLSAGSVFPSCVSQLFLSQISLSTPVLHLPPEFLPANHLCFCHSLSPPIPSPAACSFVD